MRMMATAAGGAPLDSAKIVSPATMSPSIIQVGSECLADAYLGLPVAPAAAASMICWKKRRPISPIGAMFLAMVCN